MTDGLARREAHDPLGAIARRIVQLQKEHLGRGPRSVRVHLFDELIAVVLHDLYTPLEHMLLASGSADAVFATRRKVHDVMNPLYRSVVEEETGRTVDAVMGLNHSAPDLAVTLFVLAAAPKPPSG